MEALISKARLPISEGSQQATVLILVAVSANLIFPGEVFYQSKFLLLVFSTLACAIVFCQEASQGISRRVLKLLSEAFLPLICLLPSVFMSVNFARSQDVWLLFFSYSCLYFSLRAGKISATLLTGCLACVLAVALLVELQAVYQSLFGLQELHEEVSVSSGMDAGFKSVLLTRIESGRVFAHFALPNTLAGFLTMVIPLNLVLIFTSFNLPQQLPDVGWSILRILGSSLTRGILFLQLALSLVTLILTQSFGGWLCCFGSLAITGLILSCQSKIARRKIVVVVLIMVILSSVWLAWIGHRRGFSLFDLNAGENPISLRWIAFRTAWKILEDFPLFGVGLGNYGVLNPRYQESPLLVTQYSHNTPLQLIAECGLLILPLAMVLGVLFLIRIRSSHTETERLQMSYFLKLGLLTAVVAWGIHNCLDIDFYFPSLGSLGFLFVGSIFQSDSTRSTTSSPTSGSRMLKFAFLVSLALPLMLGARIYMSQTLARLAIDYNNQNLDQALEFARWARRLNPVDANVVALDSKLAAASSAMKTREDSLKRLRDGFEQASRLDPFNAEFHYQLGRIYTILGNKRQARAAAESARNLFPSEPKYKQGTENQ